MHDAGCRQDAIDNQPGYVEPTWYHSTDDPAANPTNERSQVILK